MSLAPTKNEIRMVSKYALERCKKYYPVVKYFIITPPKADIIYTDSIGEEYSDPYTIHPYVEEAPSADLLKKWGFERDHPIVIVVMKMEFDELGIVPKDQDSFSYNGTEYEVTNKSIKPTDLFGPQNFIIGVALAANVKTPKIYDDNRGDKTLSRPSNQVKQVLGYED